MEERPLEESELVERAKGGDLAAYEEIVRRYSEPALRAAYIVTASAADAEDVAQDAFVKAYRALPRFRTGATLRPWLLRIVANEARNLRKAAGRRRALMLRASNDPVGPEVLPSAEAAALERAERERLLAAVNGLSANDRLVIGYRFFLELSEAETAEALGVARGTVKSRLSRALERLRSHLADPAGLTEGER